MNFPNFFTLLTFIAFLDQCASTETNLRSKSKLNEKDNQDFFWERELTSSSGHHHKGKGSKGKSSTTNESKSKGTRTAYSKTISNEQHLDTNQYSSEMDALLHPADDVRLEGKGYQRSYYMNLDSMKQMEEYKQFNPDHAVP